MARKKRRSPEKQWRFDQQQDYDYYHTRQYKLKLNKKTDKDVIDWIESKKASYRHNTTFQGEIKRLIREEIARERE